MSRKFNPDVYYYEFLPHVDVLFTTTVDKIDTDIPRNNYCPYCKRLLTKESMTINGDKNNGYYRLYGTFCEKCRILYVPKNVLLMLNTECKNKFPYNIVMRKAGINNLSKTSSDHSKDNYHKQKESAKIFQDNKNIICVINAVSTATSQQNTFFITNTKDTQGKPMYYHYDVEFARELLAAAFRKEKGGKYNHEGNEGVVTNALPNNSLFSDQIKDSIRLKKGGGLYSAVRRGGESIVDLLFYSPYTKRYELIRATYNKYDDEYFVDTLVFRRFINEYGNPVIKLYVRSEEDDYDFFDAELNEKSLLKEYGYDTTKSDDYRRIVLAEMIDLGILEPSKIIYYLNMFLKLNGPQRNKQRACSIWERDLKYVQNYRVNPQRFLIPKL